MSAFFSQYRWLVAIGVALLLVSVLSVAVYEPPPGEDAGPALRTASNRPSGARALMLWLSSLGYDTERVAFREFNVDPDTDVLFVLQPTSRFEDAHVERVRRWVADGGALVVAADRPNDLLRAFSMDVSLSFAGSSEVQPLQPAFNAATVRSVAVSGRAWLSPREPHWVPLLGEPGNPSRVALASWAFGQGTILALSEPALLSNARLGEGDNAAVALNLLAGARPGSVVAFDEYHQGLTEHGTLTARLTREPWGWAIIYVSLLALLYLAFSGRRFGRAIARPPIAALRSRAEYVATMGALLRRGGHLDWLRREHATHVKRAVGARFRVRADQPAREFAAAIADRHGDAAQLGPLLERLESPYPVGERETIALMREVDAIQKRLTGQSAPGR